MWRDNKKENVNNEFDELTKSLAESVTRRTALKKFGVGLAGMALAFLGLANKARAATWNGYCQVQEIKFIHGKKWVPTGICLGRDASGICSIQTEYNVCLGGNAGDGKLGPCGYWSTKLPCSF
jgi:hypothetical protein